MTKPKPITIIGGGLAGLTLGIGLRRSGVPVSIWEAGRYPRHRVCGEFISGEGHAVLERLGLRSSFEHAGAFHAQTALFVCGRNRSPVHPLPKPALCLSRFRMDALLASEFRDAGGELRENTRWTAPEFGEGVVRAAGRRVHAPENAWRWFGIKAHVPSTPTMHLAADLEMHVSSSGYVGVNRVDHDEVNVCGLFRTRPGDDRQTSKRRRLRGPCGSLLHQRLESVEFDEASFCSVAGLDLAPRKAVNRTDCCIGDAMTMTPPVTGNGMSMAFESAEIAIGPLTAYSCGRSSWDVAQRTIAESCDHAFARRLAWARFLQWLMFSPLLRSPAGFLLLQSESLWKLLFEKTR